MSKSELISHDWSAADAMISNFPGLRFIEPQAATLLGSPLGCNSMVKCLDDQLLQLKLIGKRLCHLQDPITILHHSFAIPKLLHILFTSPASHLACYPGMNSFCPSYPGLSTLISILAAGITASWIWFRSASHLAPSAFLASTDGASTLVQQLLPPHLASTVYSERDSALSVWHLG